jgi:hypothetical protein
MLDRIYGIPNKVDLNVSGKMDVIIEKPDFLTSDEN